MCYLLPYYRSECVNLISLSLVGRGNEYSVPEKGLEGYLKFKVQDVDQGCAVLHGDEVEFM